MKGPGCLKVVYGKLKNPGTLHLLRKTENRGPRTQNLIKTTMQKYFISTAVLIFFTLTINAQLWKLRRYEATAGIGTTQFFGDIGGFSKTKNLLGLKDFTFMHTRFNISSSMKYRIRDDVSARLSLAFGSFHSSDAKGSNEDRGLESRTLFFEPSLIGEYYFIKNKGENSFLLMKGQGRSFRSIISLCDFYAFSGIGGLSYKVKPNENLSVMGIKTKGFTAVVPMGLGMNLNYTSYVSFGIELGRRFSFSDYLDGYTSQFSKSNDTYYFLNFTLSYKIKTGENGLPSF
jgi:hypothetical protein